VDSIIGLRSEVPRSISGSGETWFFTTLPVRNYVAPERPAFSARSANIKSPNDLVGQFLHTLGDDIKLEYPYTAACRGKRIEMITKLP